MAIVSKLTWAGGKATIYTRRGNDWTRQFRWIADAVANLPAKHAIIDGEAVVLSEAGIADFHALRVELDGRSRRLRLQAFDLLALDGEDLRARPLVLPAGRSFWRSQFKRRQTPSRR